MNDEVWFVVESANPEIQTIVVGRNCLGYRIDIHPSDEVKFEGDDTIQDDLGSVLRILKNYVHSSARWVNCDTRQESHVWDALVALASIEDSR